MLAHKKTCCSAAFRQARPTPGLRAAPFQLPPARQTAVSRALPVPKSDVIRDSDEEVLVSLEERFKMADIDGYVLPCLPAQQDSQQEQSIGPAALS